jgi:hypothetical protein
MTDGSFCIPGNKTIIRPSTYFNKCSVGNLILLAKDTNSGIVYLKHFWIQEDFIHELCSLLPSFKDTDYIYCLDQVVGKQFEKEIGKIPIGNNPVLWSYQL